MTVYLYLNDEVEEGGGTNFPELNVTVTSKARKSCAVAQCTGRASK